jgi:hypothetical protein
VLIADTARTDLARSATFTESERLLAAGLRCLSPHSELVGVG